MGHITNADAKQFQPMNVNYGLFPELPGRVKKKEKRGLLARRALDALEPWLNSLQEQNAQAHLQGDSMSGKKENQEISVLGRLFSLEMFLFLMGIGCLVSGAITGELIQLFWGVMISVGSVILHFVRKKDWKKHWEDLEQQRQLYEQRERARKEHDEAGKK